MDRRSTHRYPVTGTSKTSLPTSDTSIGHTGTVQLTAQHALECEAGGLVISRHDEIKYELSDIASKALIPSAVRDEPLIHTSRRAFQMPALDQSNPSVSRNLHRNRCDD
jgi:hypothetical protein